MSLGYVFRRCAQGKIDMLAKGKAHEEHEGKEGMS